MPDVTAAPRPDPAAVVSRGPDVHGDVVVAGTRVPARALLDDVRRGRAMRDFLDGFPTVASWSADGFLTILGWALSGPRAPRSAPPARDDLRVTS